MCGQEGDEAVRGPSATLRDSSQVECGNHSSSMLVGNLFLSDCLIVHRKHILTSERDWVPGRHQPKRRRLRWVPFRRSFCPWVGPFYALSSNGANRQRIANKF